MDAGEMATCEVKVPRTQFQSMLESGTGFGILILLFKETMQPFRFFLAAPVTAA